MIAIIIAQLLNPYTVWTLYVILIILLVLTAAPTYLNIIAFRALQARHAGLSGLVVLSPCAVH